MKAPETIYIAVYPNDDGLDTHLGDWYSEPEYHAEDNLEYIRKDALLEWLENKIKISDGGFVNGLCCLAYRDVIEHLNGM